ncbi:hypothetical protein IMG5_166220 [Ichthyophthirius multifiliis]|uniref:DOMON domain-containing protein n=1 Tax=Ichthyophthirius multifiliis TaxID=5932 RepID=G0R0Q5_ICHMU|nr:hypothetical protein IMG5_166220 [Ichthyophthirius multifiliis]EGR28955.1 hypothetical protein IMG5_166220 [Ichthyophthirius multifiliis]|eukprot:XP_004030191.1 hypothetical protein IMG5_166220 [Ichthyophthirius multifiliis]
MKTTLSIFLLLIFLNSTLSLNTNLITLGGVSISYTIDPAAKTSQFQVQVTNKGWVGIGYGPEMNKADMVSLRWVNNAVSIEDRWSDAAVTPKLDTDIVGCSSTLVANANPSTYDPATGQWNAYFTKSFAGNACNYTFTDKSKVKISVAFGSDPTNFTIHKSAKNEEFDISSDKSGDQTSFSGLLKCQIVFLAFACLCFLI